MIQFTCTSDLLNTVNASNGRSVSIKYKELVKQKHLGITPIKASDNKYSQRLWVRDAAAGVGTVKVFYEPTTKKNILQLLDMEYSRYRELLDIAKRRFCS